MWCQMNEVVKHHTSKVPTILCIEMYSNSPGWLELLYVLISERVYQVPKRVNILVSYMCHRGKYACIVVTHKTLSTFKNSDLDEGFLHAALFLLRWEWKFMTILSNTQHKRNKNLAVIKWVEQLLCRTYVRTCSYERPISIKKVLSF